MTIIIRKPTWCDLSYLQDIDLKCFEDMWSLEFWRNILENNLFHVLVGNHNNHVAGFIVWWKNIIVRLGVKSSYRKLGCASKLLSEYMKALEGQYLTAKINVPENLCDIRYDKTTVSWLSLHGFRATSMQEPDQFNSEYVIVFQVPLTGVSLHAKTATNT